MTEDEVRKTTEYQSSVATYLEARERIEVMSKQIRMVLLKVESPGTTRGSLPGSDNWPTANEITAAITSVVSAHSDAVAKWDALPASLRELGLSPPKSLPLVP
jgi:hypothetical protein